MRLLILGLAILFSLTTHASEKALSLTPGVYSNTDLPNACAFEVKSAGADLYELKYTAEPLTLTACDQEGEHFVTLKCLGNQCLDLDGLGLKVAESLPGKFKIYNIKYPILYWDLKLTSDRKVWPRIFKAQAHKEWRWPFASHERSQCDLSNGYSKLCKNLNDHDINTEFSDLVLLKEATANGVEKCQAYGYKDCRVTHNSTSVYLNDTEALMYKSGKRTYVKVKGY